jgi:hypothetical protein
MTDSNWLTVADVIAASNAQLAAPFRAEMGEPDLSPPREDALLSQAAAITVAAQEAKLVAEDEGWRALARARQVSAARSRRFDRDRYVVSLRARSSRVSGRPSRASGRPSPLGWGGSSRLVVR